MSVSTIRNDLVPPVEEMVTMGSKAELPVVIRHSLKRTRFRLEMTLVR